MANVTIPNLTSATTIVPSTDLMVLEQTEGTRKATLSQIFTSSATSGSGLGITSGAVYTIKNGLDTDISDINTLLGNTSISGIGDGSVTGAISQINSDLTKRIEFNNYDQSVVQWNGTDGTFNWLFKFKSTNTWFALKISYSGLEYVVSEDGGQTWRTLWTK